MLSRHRQQRTYDRHMSAKHLILSMSDVQSYLYCERHVSDICRQYVGLMSAICPPSRSVKHLSLGFRLCRRDVMTHAVHICDGYL